MANHEINEEQEAVNKALRMIETSDPVHADVYNALFSILINNDVFLEKLANKMVQQVMISHVMDSTNPDMVMGADQGPVITKLIEKVQKQVDVLNTKAKNINRKELTKKLYDGQTCFVVGIVNGAKNRISFPFPFNIMPSSVDFPNNDLNILNQEIIGISNSTINADCLEIITEKSYAIGSPVVACITWHYD